MRVLSQDQVTQPAAGVAPGLGPRFMLPGIVLIAVFFVAIGIASDEPLSATQRAAITGGLSFSAAAMSIPTCALLMYQYRFGGRRSDFDAGVIALLASTMWLLPSLGAPLVFDAGYITVLLGVGVGLTVLCLAMTSSEQRQGHVEVAGAQTWRRLLVSAGVVAATAVLLVVVDKMVPSLDVETAAEVPNALLFGIAGSVLLVRAYRAFDRSLGYVGMNLIGLQLGYSLTTVDTDPHSGAWLGAAVVSVAAASIGIVGALSLAKASAVERERQLLVASLYRVEAIQIASDAEEQIHDLRSGLLSVEAFAGSMERTPSVDLLVEEVARLREMISASRESDFVQLDELAERIAVARRALGTHVVTHVEPGVGVVANRCDVIEVVQNLIDNAVSHGEASLIELLGARDGDAVSLRVADNGSGFDESTLPLVFERGYSTSHRGTGLGLHIVSKMVHRMGGTVSAMNRRSGGALVEIRLPAAESSIRTPLDVDV